MESSAQGMGAMKGGAGGKNPNPAAAALRIAGKTIATGGASKMESAKGHAENVRPVKYHRGGKVRKTGPAVLKRNERVIPASKRKKAEKVLRKAGMSLTNNRHGKKRKAGRSSGRS